MNKISIIVFLIILVGIVSCQEKNTINKEIITIYYDNGSKKLEYECLNDSIKDGFYIEYYQSGQMKERSYYLKGKRFGWSNYYDSLGNLKVVEQNRLYYEDNALCYTEEDTFNIHEKTSFVNVRWVFKEQQLDSLSSFFYTIYNRKGQDTIFLGDTIIFDVILHESYFKADHTKYCFFYTARENKDSADFICKEREPWGAFTYIPKQKGSGKIYGMITEELLYSPYDIVPYFFDFEYFVK
jgi:hypothetical protein